MFLLRVFGINSVRVFFVCVVRSNTAVLFVKRTYVEFYFKQIPSKVTSTQTFSDLQESLVSPIREMSLWVGQCD